MSNETLFSIFNDEAPLPAHVDPVERQFQQIKSTIHQRMVESLDLSHIADLDRQVLLKHIRNLAAEACESRDEILSQLDQERLLDELSSEVFGLGPLDRLMRDPDVTDILVNDPYTVYIERRGRLELTDVIFADEQHLMRIIRRIVAKLGRRIDTVSPMVDARLPDGSRVNAVVPPLALDGPSVSIRRFGKEPLRIHDLVKFQSITPEMVRFLSAAVEARLGIVISGGTGGGKTTLLNSMSAFIPPEERLVTIEDSAELVLQHKHRVRMETRTANTEGSGAVTQRDLVRNSLRMRPDRILVGEVRGPEVWDMLQAMNTGHEGSMTTIHANSAMDALARMEMMVAMGGFEMPIDVVRNYIATGIRLLVHVSRLKGGPRKVMQIIEITGVKDGTYRLQEIYGFQQTGIDKQGQAVGQFHATGYQPECLDRIAAYGIELPGGMFQAGLRDFTHQTYNGHQEVVEILDD